MDSNLDRVFEQEHAGNYQRLVYDINTHDFILQDILDVISPDKVVLMVFAEIFQPPVYLLESEVYWHEVRSSTSNGTVA